MKDNSLTNQIALIVSIMVALLVAVSIGSLPPLAPSPTPTPTEATFNFGFANSLPQMEFEISGHLTTKNILELNLVRTLLIAGEATPSPLFYEVKANGSVICTGNVAEKVSCSHYHHMQIVGLTVTIGGCFKDLEVPIKPNKDFVLVGKCEAQ